MNLSDAFQLLTVFDSPLTPVQAPELMKYKPEIDAAVKELSTGGCTSCKKRTIAAKLADIQTRMEDEINKNDQLKGLVPTLLASAKLSNQ